MVLWYNNGHNYDFNFATVSLAYFNRYPNPYSRHVISVDTIDRFVDEDGKLHTVRLVMKTGRLPKWIKPLLGSKITSSWIIERTIVDPKERTMHTYTRNLDHTKVLRIEEYNIYRCNSFKEKPLKPSDLIETIASGEQSPLRSNPTNPKKPWASLFSRSDRSTLQQNIKDHISDVEDDSTVSVTQHVKISSNLGRWGIKDRIEKWSHQRFSDNISNSRRGMFFVMNMMKEAGYNGFRLYQMNSVTQNITMANQ